MKRRSLLMALFAFFFVLTAIFAVRLVVFGVVRHRADEGNIALSGWMTPRFVSHAYHLPPESVAQAIGLSQDDNQGRRTLSQIAFERGEAVEEVEDRLRDLIEASRIEAIVPQGVVRP